jgi:hypothetical protein
LRRVRRLAHKFGGAGRHLPLHGCAEATIQPGQRQGTGRAAQKDCILEFSGAPSTPSVIGSRSDSVLPERLRCRPNLLQGVCRVALPEAFPERPSRQGRHRDDQRYNKIPEGEPEHKARKPEQPNRRHRRPD